jgi:hypothetical protein
MNVRTTKTASSYVERLSQKVERLEECLLAPMAVGTRNWVQRVGWAFDEMIDAWSLHRSNFDSDDGPLSAERLKGTTLPALDRRAESLQREHQRLRNSLEAMRTRLDEAARSSSRSPKVLDLLRIRRRGRQLLDEIRKHKEKETILLHGQHERGYWRRRLAHAWSQGQESP